MFSQQDWDIAQEVFFFDVAYRYSKENYFDSLYPAPPTDFYQKPEMVEFENIKNNVVFTLGFKF